MSAFVQLWAGAAEVSFRHVNKTNDGIVHFSSVRQNDIKGCCSMMMMPTRPSH